MHHRLGVRLETRTGRFLDGHAQRVHGQVLTAVPGAQTSWTITREAVNRESQRYRLPRAHGIASFRRSGRGWPRRVPTEDFAARRLAPTSPRRSCGNLKARQVRRPPRGNGTALTVRPGTEALGRAREGLPRPALLP